MKYVLRFNSIVCILSPWMFIIVQKFGYNHPHDSYIFMFFFGIMAITVFLESGGE